MIRPFLFGKFKLSSFLDMVSKIQLEKVSAMTRNSISKMALQEKKIKDPNAGVFTDMSGYVSDSSYVDQSIIYAIFDNDDFSYVAHDHPFYMYIHNSQLHCVAARPPFMPYIDPVKWELDHVDLNQRMFHDIDNVSIASFHPNVFPRAYALTTHKQLFSLKPSPNSITSQIQ